jgi:hypothetical protein
MKFSVGDFVRAHTQMFPNTVGKVIKVDPDDDEFPYEVEFDGPGLYVTEIFAEKNLEVV